LDYNTGDVFQQNLPWSCFVEVVRHLRKVAVSILIYFAIILLTKVFFLQSHLSFMLNMPGILTAKRMTCAALKPQRELHSYMFSNFQRFANAKFSHFFKVVFISNISVAVREIIGNQKSNKARS